MLKMNNISACSWWIGKMSTLSCTRYLWAHTTRRHCSDFQSKLKNFDQIAALNKSNEDIASYVRFNRDVQKSLTTDSFRDLYSKAANPGKTEHELEEIRLRISVICAEYEYFSFTNMRVPSSISTEDMKIMLNLKTPEARQLFLIKSYFRDTVKIRAKVKKIVKRAQKPINTSPIESGCFSSAGKLQYGLWKNNLFTRISDSRRQRSQLGLNAALWGQVVAFDWSLPVRFLDESQELDSSKMDDPLVNRVISERSWRTLCLKIFIICNNNLKSSLGGQPPLNIVHCNMENAVLANYLQESFDISALDRQFFRCSTHSYLNDYADKRIVYINPLAGETLNEQDIYHPDETVFVFSPYHELMGLQHRVLKQMYQLKMESEHQKVHFRRLPLHDWTNNRGHISLTHYIQGFHDVLQRNATWLQVLHRYVPRKYHAVQ